MSQITVTSTGDTVTLSAPYQPDLPSKAKAIGGKWNAADKSWRFAARDEQRVRDLAREIYGTDGDDAGASQTVTVRITVDDWFGVVYGQRGGEHLDMFGRQLVTRRSRDEAVRLGEGVIIISGFPGSGGSVANPRLDARDGTVLEVRDVPATHADVARPKVTIVDTTIDRDALVAERDRLAARIAEINALLEA